MTDSIRVAHPDELVEILAVERLAGERFRAYGLLPPENREHKNSTPEQLASIGHEHLEGIYDKRLWVALDEGKIVGFALAMELDNEGHLRELDVLQSHGRQGIGRALVQRVIDWCRFKKYPSLTLTTFSDIPWNRPYYEKLGFMVIPIDSLQGNLLRMAEKELETFTKDRVTMRLIL